MPESAISSMSLGNLCAEFDFRHRDLPVERILEHARTHLAVFKVPRYVAFISALPRTVTNKVLKREMMNMSDPLSGAYDSQEKISAKAAVSVQRAQQPLQHLMNWVLCL